MVHFIKCSDTNFFVNCKFHITEKKFHAFELFLRTNQIPYKLVLETKSFVNCGVVYEYFIELTLEELITCLKFYVL